jgi:hypothetical protein
MAITVVSYHGRWNYCIVNGNVTLCIDDWILCLLHVIVSDSVKLPGVVVGVGDDAALFGHRCRRVQSGMACMQPLKCLFILCEQQDQQVD